MFFLVRVRPVYADGRSDPGATVNHLLCRHRGKIVAAPRPIVTLLLPVWDRAVTAALVVGRTDRYMPVMASSPRAYRVSLLVSATLFFLSPVAAQVVPATPAAAAPLPSLDGVDRSAWLYRGSDITPDKAWHFGTLRNGVRYAVRRNGVPPGQVAVRVRIDAGSLAETDEQRGYAHLIEHLSFRGSAYVPDGEAKRVWQRFGATFGSDSNAQTSPVATLYKLDLPSASQAGVDESLHILSGMMERPAITPAALKGELPVVLAEQREQPGAQVRLGEAANALLYAGQPLATRSPIGTVKVLEAATPASVQAFHDRWYRPERALVIISGDIDPEMAEKLVVKNFADWKGVGPSPADPDFGAPDPKRPATAAMVEPGLPVLVAMGTVRPWHFNADTVIFNQRRLVDILATRLINRRLEQRARAGGSFLQAGVTLDDVQRSANVTSVSIVPAGDNWRAALIDVRRVIADALANPPTQAAIDREYADFDAAMRNEADTSAVEAGAKQADDMAAALDIRETVTSPGASYEVLKAARAKGMFTPAALLASTRRLFRGTATRALVNLHAADPAAPAALAAALAEPIKAAAPGRAAGQRAATAVALALPIFGPPGTVASRQPIPDLGMEQVNYTNGVRLLLHPTASETGRVYVRVRFGGGYAALPADPAAPVWAGDDALMASGVGALKQDDLEALTAGKTVGLQFSVGDDAFSIAGLTSPTDYRDQLRLIAAKLDQPGWDPAPVQRAKAGALAALPGLNNSPTGVIGRDLDELLHSGDPRWANPTAAQIEATTPASFRALWAPVLASGPIEVSVFGDVKSDEAIAAVAATFGALKPRAPVEVATVASRFPAHVAQPVERRHDGDANQAAAVIAWPTGSGVEGIREGRQLDVLAQVFSDRLFDKLRNAAGASYSPQVASQWPIGGAAGVGRFIAIGQVPPDKAAYFFTLAREIAADLATRPIGDDELQRLLGPMKQSFLRSATGNLFWLRQVGGAAFDERRYAATREIARDLVGTTPASLQALAAKYLRADKDWTLAVLPRETASVPAAAPG